MLPYKALKIIDHAAIESGHWQTTRGYNTIFSAYIKYGRVDTDY